MRAMRCWMGVGLIAVLSMGGCTGDEHESLDRARDAARRIGMVAEPLSMPAPPPPMTAADSARERTRISSEQKSVQAAFAKGTRLKKEEVMALRQDLNAKQVASARALGQQISSEADIQRLVREGRLVALGDSTPYWILRTMTHSNPYVTPDTRTLLLALGRRFHARLDRLGLPRYRMKITSALRTDATQAQLRLINSYAARTTSAHQFATTVDVSHARFAVPAPDESVQGWEMESEMLDRVGLQNAAILRAELGRALADLRSMGAVHVMMEDQQPVYHFTLARPFHSVMASATPAPRPTIGPASAR